MLTYVKRRVPDFCLVLESAYKLEVSIRTACFYLLPPVGLRHMDILYVTGLARRAGNLNSGSSNSDFSVMETSLPVEKNYVKC